MSAITPHAYEPSGEHWTVCLHCGLAEAAHDLSITEGYRTEGAYRCPDCVTNGTDPCPHPQPRRPEI